MFYAMGWFLGFIKFPQHSQKTVHIDIGFRVTLSRLFLNEEALKKIAVEEVAKLLIRVLSAGKGAGFILSKFLIKSKAVLIKWLVWGFNLRPL